MVISLVCRCLETVDYHMEAEKSYFYHRTFPHDTFSPHKLHGELIFAVARGSYDFVLGVDAYVFVIPNYILSRDGVMYLHQLALWSVWSKYISVLLMLLRLLWYSISKGGTSVWFHQRCMVLHGLSLCASGQIISKLWISNNISICIVEHGLSPSLSLSTFFAWRKA